MQQVRVYWMTAEIISPTIITSEVGRKGFVYSVFTDIIPGSIFKGAILTAALVENVLKSREDANQMAKSPDFAFSPLVRSSSQDIMPLSNLLITHELCYTTKWEKDKIFSLGAHKLATAIDYEHSLMELEDHFLSHKIKEGWKYAPGEIKKQPGRPAIKKNGSWRLLSDGPLESYYIQVALDHSRGSAAPGMLYAYEHIIPGILYSGVAITSSVCPLRDLLERNTVNVRIGRGISRGFGKVRLNIRTLQLPRLSELRGGEQVVLEALSPVFVEDPLPRPPKKGDLLVLDPNWYDRLLNVDINAGFRVKAVIGRFTTYRGWSLRTKLPKLPISALAEGSLLICEVEEKIPSEVSTVLPVVGLNRRASSGFNQLLPLTPDPFGDD